MKQIQTEQIYLKSVDGFIRRFKDYNGVFWYVYKELCNIICIPEQARKNIFNYKLNEEDKAQFSDDSLSRIDLYINTNALREMINRNNERVEGIYKEILNNENREANEYKSDLDKSFIDLSNLIQRPGPIDLAEACVKVQQISKMPEYKQTMDKYCDNYNIEIEEAVDRIREYMYEGEIDYIIGESKEGDRIIELYKENDVWNTWI